MIFARLLKLFSSENRSGRAGQGSGRSGQDYGLSFASYLSRGAVLAGADPKRVYGIEIDGDIVKISQERLSRLGVPTDNIRLGDALQASSYNF